MHTVPHSDQQAQRELESRAAGIEAVGTWHATRTIQACREACRGAGYMAENRLPMLKADTDVFTTFEGDNTVLLQLVAKGLLTSHRDAFGDLDTLGIVRLGARQAVDAVIERTAARSLIQRLIDATPLRNDDANLMDRGLHLRMFEDREQHVLQGLARRLRNAGGPGRNTTDAFAVFSEAQDHVLLAARVHVDIPLEWLGSPIAMGAGPASAGQPAVRCTTRDPTAAFKHAVPIPSSRPLAQTGGLKRPVHV